MNGRRKAIRGGLAVFGMLLAMAGCDSQRISELEEGVATEADVRARFGTPDAVWDEPGGGRIFEYNRQPAGQRNYQITVGPDGRMTALRQVLQPATFAKVQPGMTAAQVRRLLGRPEFVPFAHVDPATTTTMADRVASGMCWRRAPAPARRPAAPAHAPCRPPAAAAGAHVGGGAGDGAGGGKAAEKRRGEVGDALGDEFLVGVVAVVDGAVGDPRRQQRLDGAEQGDGEGRGDQLAEGGPGRAGQRKGGQSCGMPLKRLPMVSTGRCSRHWPPWRAPARPAGRAGGAGG
jgi:hypothetical protein